MYAKTHADIPLSVEERAAEVRKIKRAVAAFSSEMEARMIQKLQEGWRGWDNPEHAKEIYNCMVAHGAAIPLATGQEPDIGNFAMALWWNRIGRDRNPDMDPSPAAPGLRPSGLDGGAAAEVEPEFEGNHPVKQVAA